MQFTLGFIKKREEYFYEIEQKLQNCKYESTAGSKKTAKKWQKQHLALVSQVSSLQKLLDIIFYFCTAVDAFQASIRRASVYCTMYRVKDFPFRINLTLSEQDIQQGLELLEEYTEDINLKPTKKIYW